ncbi:MAG: hypothetical protein K6F59_00810 [Gammaproteobacteria bacterium]|nr:hypothetical protein [Gammaproteobacteria bacterium]
MKYSKEFKLDCIKKYKSGAHIEDPPGAKHKAFHNMMLKWVHMYDYLGEAGLDHNKPKLSLKEIIKLIERVEAGESYSQVAFSTGRQNDVLIKWHKIYRQDGIDGLKSLKRGRKPMTTKNKAKQKDSLTQEERIKELEETNEYLRAENEYLKKLNALVQKRKAQEPKKK